MRLQCGGLQGLRACAAAGDPDVHRAVAAARAKHGSLADLPWTQIVAAIVGWQGRSARSRVPR
jgi:hypothetical protein